MLVFLVLCVFLLFFFFKQKTAYEMRISDWSSDVCSSDLIGIILRLDLALDAALAEIERAQRPDLDRAGDAALDEVRLLGLIDLDIVDQLRRELVEVDRAVAAAVGRITAVEGDRKSTRLNSSH